MTMAETWDERKKRIVAGVTAGTTVVVTLGLIFPFVFSKSPLPFMATPNRKVFANLNRTIASRSLNNKVFVDLGSGDGEAVYQALNAGYNKAIGVELNFSLFLISNVRRLVYWPSEYRSRSRFYHQNFFDFKLDGAGTVMIFGVPSLMKPVSKKLARECEPGTFILSYRFPLPTANAQEGDELARAVLLYHEEEMRVYQIR